MDGKSLFKSLRDVADKAADAAKEATTMAVDVARDTATRAASVAKDTAGKATEAAKEAASNVTLPEVNLPEIELPDVKLPDIELPEVRMPWSGEDADGAASDATGAEERKASGERESVSVAAAMRLMYFMMAADGEILSDEEARFEEICFALDGDFADHREGVVAECAAQVGSVPEGEGRLSALVDMADDILAVPTQETDVTIPARLLVWDLIVVAHSDSDFGEDERKLVDHIAHSLGIDKGVYAELLSSYLTMEDLEHELEWAKGTDRQYRVVEAIVDEASVRRDAVMEGVMALVAM